MQRNFIKAGWSLIALGAGVLAAVVTTGALLAKGDSAFTRWVGWATIWALVMAAIGIVSLVWDKVRGNDIHGDLPAIGERLAKTVYLEATDTRRRLIGLGEVSDHRPANVRFAKIPGRFRDVAAPPAGDLRNILRYYQDLSPARMVILGEPGAGKTVLAIELQVRLLEQRKRNSALPIPVLISAAAYDTRQTWPQWLAAHLAARYTISTATAAELIADGRILPVVDGLDEMDTAAVAPARAKYGRHRVRKAGAAGAGTRTPARAAALVHELNASYHGREPAPVVITSRPREYEQLDRGADGAACIQMIPLNGDESSSYLQGQFSRADEAHRWAPVINALRADPEGPLAARLGTPWRLALALGAFRDTGKPAALLRQTPGVPCEAPAGAMTAMDHQLLAQYVSNAVRLHDKTARYRAADVQRWLTALASGLAWQAHHAKSATDIELATWWEASARRTAQLAHTAPLLVPAAALAGLLGYTHWLKYSYWLNRIAAAAIFFLVLAAMAARSPSPRRLAVRQIRTRQGAGRFSRGFALGVALGSLLGLASTPEPGNAPLREQVLSSGLSALVFGAAFGLIAGLASGLADSAPKTVRPRDVIKADGRYMFSVAAIIILLLGLGIGLTVAVSTFLSHIWGDSTSPIWPDALTGCIIGAATGLVLGPLIGVTGAGGRGSSAWTRYRITVVINWLRRRAPLRFGAFLDWSHDAGLLRVSGVAYQFRHLQLQEWLAAQNKKPQP